MGDRVIRGTRLGAASYEPDRNYDLAPRKTAVYACALGHRTHVPLAEEADTPLEWQCRRCSQPARLVGGPEPERKPGKPIRTHLDMLRERRSSAELEVVLREQLDALHAAQAAAKAPRKRSA